MASGSLGRLSVDLLLETAQWGLGLNKADHEAAKFADAIEGKFNKLAGSVGDFLKGMAAGLIAGFATERIFGAIKATTDLADRFDELAQKSASSVKTIAELSVYAEMSGTNIESLAAGMSKFNKAFIEASNDSTSNPAKIFKALNIEIRNADGTLRSAEEMSKRAMKAFGGLTDSAAKTAGAMVLWGKAGADNIPVMNAQFQASEELKASISRYADAMVLLKDPASALEEQTTILNNTNKTMIAQLAVQLVPAVTELIKQWNSLSTSGSGLNPILQGLVDAFKGIVLVVDTLITGVILMAKAFVMSNTVIFQLLKFDFKGARATFTDFFESSAETVTNFGKRASALLDPLNQVGNKLKDTADASKKMGDALSKVKLVEIGFSGNTLKQLDLSTKAIDKINKSLEELDKNMLDLQKQEEKQLADFRSVGDEAELAAQKIGMTADEVARLDAWLKLMDKTKRSISMEEWAEQWERINAALANKKAREENLAFLNDLEGAYRGAFDSIFDDIDDGWKGMLNSLRKSFKKMLVEYVYSAFAKPLFLQITAQLGGGGGSGSLTGGGGGEGGFGGLFQAGADYARSWFTDSPQFSAGGSWSPGSTGLMEWAPGGGSAWSSNAWGGAGVAGAGIVGGVVGGWGAGAMGAGDRGVAAGSQWGSGLAAAGMMIYGPIGAAIGMAIGALIGKFTDPDPDAMRSAVFGATAGSENPTAWQTTSAFGSFGFSDGSWLSEEDMGETVTAFLAGLTSMDNALAEFMSPEQIARVSARLAEAGRRYELGMEHGGVDNLGQITQDRLAIITSEINEALGAFIAAFTGPVEAMIALTDAYLTATGGGIEEAIEAIANAPKSMMESYQQQLGALRDMDIDVSTESLTALTASMTEFQAATIMMVGAIDAAAASMHAMFMTTADDIRMSVMTEEQKYQFLQDRSNSLFDQLQMETDPEKIAALAQRINADITSAWNMLDPEAQAASVQDYLDRLAMVDATVADKMAALRDLMIEDAGEVMSGIADRLEELFGQAETTAATNTAAANTMNNAANTFAGAAVNGG